MMVFSIVFPYYYLGFVYILILSEFQSREVGSYEGIFHNVLHKIALFCRKLLIENVSLA